MRILVVEDESNIREGIMGILKRDVPFACKVFGAADLNAALALIQRYDPNLVISDIVLTHGTGLSLLEQARAAGWTGKALLISAHEDFHYAQHAIRLGVVDYLIKPINKTRLLEHVNEVYEKLPERYARLAETPLPDIPFLNENLGREMPDSLRKIIQYIKANYARDLSLDAVSEKYSLNPKYVSTLFSKHYDLGFVATLHRYRLRKAVELLLTHDDMSIQEIGHAVGYETERTVYRAFDKYLETSPGEIRRLYRPSGL